EPQQPGARLERRAIAHEVAVTRRQVVDDLRVALAGGDLRPHLLAQVRRQRRVGLGDGLVLADQAAQLRKQRVVARVGVVLRESHAGGQRQNKQDRSIFHLSFGETSAPQASRVIGPTCLWRITPCASTTNVSGTPYTPQSMPTLPSVSRATTAYGLPWRASHWAPASGSSL